MCYYTDRNLSSWYTIIYWTLLLKIKARIDFFWNLRSRDKSWFLKRRKQIREPINMVSIRTIMYSLHIICSERLEIEEIEHLAPVFALSESSSHCFWPLTPRKIHSYIGNANLRVMIIGDTWKFLLICYIISHFSSENKNIS